MATVSPYRVSLKRLPHWLPPGIALFSVMVFLGMAIWTSIGVTEAITRALEPPDVQLGTVDYPTLNVDQLDRISERINFALPTMMEPADEMSAGEEVEEEPESGEPEEPPVEDPVDEDSEVSEGEEE